MYELNNVDSNVKMCVLKIEPNVFHLRSTTWRKNKGRVFIYTENNVLLWSLQNNSDLNYVEPNDYNFLD